MSRKSDGARALKSLTARFKSLGADDPEAWARSEVEEGIPQLGRLVFLRALWDSVLKYPAESRGTAIEVARDLCYLLEGAPPLMPGELGDLSWGLFLKNDQGPGRRLSALAESFDDAKPEGHVWGSLTSAVTLPAATDSDLGHSLKGLKRLTALWLGKSAVSDRGLRHLLKHAALEVLDLSGTKVTDACVAELKPLKNLSALYLADTAVTDKCLAGLSRFPRLDTMSFANTAVTDAGLDHLTRCGDLTFVDVKGTKATRKGIARLRKAFPGAMVRYED